MQLLFHQRKNPKNSWGFALDTESVFFGDTWRHYDILESIESGASLGL